MVKTSSKHKLQSTPQNRLHRTTRHFKGVRLRKGGKWVSEVRMPNSTGRIWLGSYDSPQQAARAYDCAVYCLRGRNANFNFPHSLPEIPSTSSLSPAQIQPAAAKFAREELRQPLRKDFPFSRSESQSFKDSHRIWEEQNCALFDFLLEEVESKQSLNFEDSPEENLECTDFVLLMEELRRLIQDAGAKFDREELRQPLKKDAAFSCWESQSSKDTHQISEQNCELLNSLLEDVESNKSLNSEKFPEEDLEGVDFVVLMEEQGALFLHQTEH
ncbi:hypothetical protein KI387_029546 [Taxus chinensis]|uniref:AP2/ERF domain-containing protein n=1 Tax=Taxus chinensis TaxID=29808 RepID=A0AA38F9V8_TAXCH|nr:hypothetical protein KI387_029546 [Taxus chinensis]